MPLLQLNPTVPVCITTKDGLHKDRMGEAFFLETDAEHHALWGIVFDDTGEIWWVPNPEVRVAHCWSRGRPPRVAPDSRAGSVKYVKCLLCEDTGYTSRVVGATEMRERCPKGCERRYEPVNGG